MIADVWTKAGKAGLPRASMPEEYGGAGGTFAHEAAINRGLRSLARHVRAPRIRDRCATSWTTVPKIRRRLVAEVSHRRAVGEIAMTARTGSYLQGVRSSAKKSGDGHAAQRLQDLHHQWPARQSDHRRRQRRARKPAPKGPLCLPSRLTMRKASAAPQAEKARHGFGRHLGIVLRGRAVAGIELARDRGGAGLLPAHEGTAAAAVDRGRACGGDDGAGLALMIDDVKQRKAFGQESSSFRTRNSSSPNERPRR